MSSYGVDEIYATNTGVGRRTLRRVLYLVGLFIVLNLAGAVLRPWLDPQTDGPYGSSFVTTEDGVGAWFDTLDALGHDVDRLRVPIDESQLDPSATVIVVAPLGLDTEYASDLADHAASGGHVILVDVANAPWVFDLDILLVGTTAGSTTVVADDPRYTDVSTVILDGGSLIDGATPLVSTDGGALVAQIPEGAGVITLVAQAAFLTNDQIGESDHAVLAVRIAGEGPIVFDEYLHGFGVDQGLQGVGAVIRRVAILGLLAALLAMWAVGKRLGPAEQAERALPPPRAAYIDALAASVAKSRDRAAFANLRSRAQRSLGRIAGRYVGLHEAEQRRKAAAQLGLDEDELAVLDDERLSDPQALATVAAKIERATSGAGVREG